jgi:hypothetical protein
MALVSKAIVFYDTMDVFTEKVDGVYEVRVLKRWFLPDYSNPEFFGGINMVLIDKNVSFLIFSFYFLCLLIDLLT